MSLIFYFLFWFASTWPGLQEEARAGFRKSQVSREVLCSDLLIILKWFVWARLCLGSVWAETLFRVFPGLVCALVKFLTGGPQALTDGNAQHIQSLPFLSARELLEHGPGTSLRNSGIFSGEKPSSFGTGKIGFKKSVPKSVLSSQMRRPQQGPWKQANRT